MYKYFGKTHFDKSSIIMLIDKNTGCINYSFAKDFPFVIFSVSKSNIGRYIIKSYGL